MKHLKYILIFFTIALIVGFSIFIFNKKNSKPKEISENNTETSNTEISRTSAENTINNISNNSNENPTENQIINTSPKNETPLSSQETQPQTTSIPIEEDISNFSTKIYSTKDSARQNNLKLTASALNGTIVKPGKTFSFTHTVGKATPERGYQKADIYDEHGDKVKGYGGGNCQISSTLYNAVLKLPSLSVIERHPHSQKVPYVPENKDAAVAYGSVDFKFVNNNDYSIKIYCEVNKKQVSIRIVKLS